jgi:hypothetical protein
MILTLSLLVFYCYFVGSISGNSFETVGEQVAVDEGALL